MPPTPPSVLQDPMAQPYTTAMQLPQMVCVLLTLDALQLADGACTTLQLSSFSQLAFVINTAKSNDLVGLVVHLSWPCLCRHCHAAPYVCSEQTVINISPRHLLSTRVL